MKIENRYKKRIKYLYSLISIFISVVFLFETLLYFSLSLDIVSISFIFHIALNIAFVYNIVTTLTPKVIVKDSFIVIYSINSLFRKKIEVKSIKNVSATKNIIVHDKLYEEDATIVDIFLTSGKMIRCAVDESYSELLINHINKNNT